MICGRCAKTLEPESIYCRYCGTRVSADGSPRRLRRRPDEGRIGGVCAGMAEYFNTDVTLVRTACVVLTVIPGLLIGGLVGYLVAWVLIPAERGRVEATGKRLYRSKTDHKLGGVCGGLAAYFGTDATPVRLAWAIITVVPVAVIPGGIICGVLAYLVAWFIIPAEAEPSLKSSQPST